MMLVGGIRGIENISESIIGFFKPNKKEETQEIKKRGIRNAYSKFPPNGNLNYLRERNDFIQKNGKFLGGGSNQGTNINNPFTFIDKERTNRIKDLKTSNTDNKNLPKSILVKSGKQTNFSTKKLMFAQEVIDKLDQKNKEQKSNLNSATGFQYKKFKSLNKDPKLPRSNMIPQPFQERNFLSLHQSLEQLELSQELAVLKLDEDSIEEINQLTESFTEDEINEGAVKLDQATEQLALQQLTRDWKKKYKYIVPDKGLAEEHLNYLALNDKAAVEVLANKRRKKLEKLVQKIEKRENLEGIKVQRLEIFKCTEELAKLARKELF